MRRVTFAVPLCLMLALAMAGCDDDENSEDFRATLSAANEVPTNPSTATGTATFSRDENTVDFEVDVNGITAVTAAHIHSGAAGVNGPIRVNLFLGPTTGNLSGTLVEASLTSTDVMGITYEALLAEMRAGTAYVNVHTTANPAGEIRGQLALD
jgi:hypothetical protein